MLTVYGRPNSSNSAKVFWLLEELGLEYDLVLTGTGYGPTNTPEFLAMNPFGKVPVVRDGEVVVWESNAVLRYLAARHGPTPLWPADEGDRSAIDRWMDWASISLIPPFTRMRKARAAGRSGDGDQPAVVAGFQALDRWLAEHDFLGGSEFTLADIVVGPSVHRWFKLPEARGSLSALSAYAERLAERPGFQRHVRDPLS